MPHLFFFSIKSVCITIWQSFNENGTLKVKREERKRKKILIQKDQSDDYLFGKSSNHVNIINIDIQVKKEVFRWL